MQINKIYGYNFENKYNNHNKETSFEGLNIKSLLTHAAKKAKEQEILNYDRSKISNILGVQTSTITDLTKGIDEKRFSFLKTLTAHYNARNFNRDNNLKESPDALIETFKHITKPQIEHFQIANKTNAPFELILQIFKNAEDKKGLSFIQKIQNDILDNSTRSAKKILKMLTSPNKKEYIEHTDNYSSYLKLNTENDNAIEELDKLVAEGKYSSRQYDVKYNVKQLIKIDNLESVFSNNIETLENNYSHEGKILLKSLFLEYFPNKKDLSKNAISDILDMYKTSNPKNIDIRTELLDRFRFAQKPEDNSDIKAMKSLFNRIDNDESSANFINNILKDNPKTNSINELEEILSIVPAKKAEIFHKNIARIINYTDKEERVKALQNEVENPFFITPGYAYRLDASIKAGFSKEESKFSKFLKKIENKINIIRYEKSQSKSSSQVSEPIKITTEKENKDNTAKIELKRTFKESREARKLRVQNDVNEIIKQKLGEKTLAKQKEAYNNGAMVMRLKLLPEIFNSIRETRKTQRLAGLRPKVENKDAIKLYSKINGKNRKLVNYMLKQTDATGERIFDIKDIIAKLNEFEIYIDKMKKINPKLSAKDIKEIYNNEFIYLNNTYGKLKRLKKK